jgi:hypothetical protein
VTESAPPSDTRDRRGRQFSLLVLLLVVLVACVSAAYWGERQRRIAAERGEAARPEADTKLSWFTGPPKPPPAFPNADPKLVHIRADTPNIGARDEPGWAWTVYLPSGTWWLYVSQGEEYDEALGKYRESVSGVQFNANGDVNIQGCLSIDVGEGSRWVQNWASGTSHAAVFSDAGLAVLQARGTVTRDVRGKSNYEFSPVRPTPHPRIQLFRWHKVLDPEAAVNATKAISGREKPLKEYGFSIYLVKEN